MNQKSVILALIVTAEVLFGSLFIFRYHQNQLQEKKVLGVDNVSVINRNNTVDGKNEDLKYYWRFAPNKKETIKLPWSSQEIIYHINGDGLNDLHDYSIEKPENVYRIITLGDSFTHGDYVDTKDNWTEQLEVLLNSSNFSCREKIFFEVINLGMPGYDVKYIVQIYKEIGQKYNPDLILWFESGSGFYRHNELMQPIIRSCTKEMDSSNLEERKKDYHPCWTKAQDQINREYSPEELSNIIQYDYDIFFSLPTTSNSVIFYYESFFEENQNIIDELKKRYVSADFVSLVSENDRYRFPDDHPNAKGHRFIAEHALEYLKSKKDICLSLE